jgi:transposase
MSYTGIDVSKASLDIHIRPEGVQWTTKNDAEGIVEMLSRLQSFQVDLVVMEATGGLEQEAANLLVAAGYPVAVVNPRQIRDFAKSTGKLAKSDKLDAGVIAHYAEAIKPANRHVVDVQGKALQELGRRRKQVVEMITIEKNRSKTVHDKVLESIHGHLSWLEKELQDIDHELKDEIENHPEWHEKNEILRSVPGVGPVTSIVLLSSMPELGKVNRKEIAALAGLAPYNRDSGTMQRKRVVWGGRAEVRSVLHMATLSAIRYNPKIKSFFESLTKAGKAFKVAMTACSRKLLTILNKMIHDRAMWQMAQV